VSSSCAPGKLSSRGSRELRIGVRIAGGLSYEDERYNRQRLWTHDEELNFNLTPDREIHLLAK
jgi:hypothetical protein